MLPVVISGSAGAEATWTSSVASKGVTAASSTGWAGVAPSGGKRLPASLVEARDDAAAADEVPAG